MICTHCHGELLEGAKFCHHCGKEQFPEKVCGACNTSNPIEALYCKNCGHPFTESLVDLPSLVDLFLDYFDREIREANGFFNKEKIHKSLSTSAFLEKVAARFDALELKYSTLEDRQLYNREIQQDFLGLLEYFLVYFCEGILPYPLSKKILKYEGMSQALIQPMAYDYLNLENWSDEDIYLNPLDIPLKGIKKAASIFFKPQKNEAILFLLDQSLTGSFREGVGLTERGIYWKSAMEPAQAVPFSAIQTLELEKNWLLINGHYFNVNPSFNFYFMRFLKKVALYIEK